MQRIELGHIIIRMAIGPRQYFVINIYTHDACMHVINCMLRNINDIYRLIDYHFSTISIKATYVSVSHL